MKIKTRKSTAQLLGAATVPVELIVKAMEEASAETLRQTTNRLGAALQELREQRARNIGS